MRYTWRTGVFEAVMIIAAIIYVSPIYLLVITAFKAPSDLTPQFIPTQDPVVDNFLTAWNEGHLGPALINSVLVTVGAVFLLVVTSSLAAYPLARITARWSKTAYYTFLFGLMLPIQLSLIPLYLAMRTIGLTGNLAGVILVFAGVQTPFCIFLFTQFLRSIPKDYDEAASLDGASRFQTYFHVLLPMLRPITGTVVVLNAVAVWNDFYLPLLYLSGSGNQTLPLAVYTFVGQWASRWNVIFAGLILGAIPILVTFLVMQKAVFRGYASGLKG